MVEEYFGKSAKLKIDADLVVKKTDDGKEITMPSEIIPDSELTTAIKEQLGGKEIRSS